MLAQQAMQDIIDLYFPDGCPTDGPTPIVTVNSTSICAGDSATLLASGAMYYQWSNGETGNSIIVHPDSTTSYTVIGKTAGYSSEPVNVEVVVNPIPVISVENINICEGQTATLTANGADTYLWSNGETGDSIIVSPTMTTVYTVTGSSSGCLSEAVEATVAVHPLPVVNINPILSDSLTFLDAFGPWDNYLWSTGETTPIIQADTSGVYTVTVTDNEGCTASASIAVEVLTSETSPGSKVDIIVAPNPVDDVVNINCIGLATSYVHVMDNLGRLVLSDRTYTTEGVTRTLYMGDLPSGVYYVQIGGKGFVRTVRIVK
jgi:hypothetical protein